MTTSCPSPQELTALGLGTCEGSCPPDLASHIESCTTCQDFLQQNALAGMEPIDSHSATLPAGITSLEGVHHQARTWPGWQRRELPGAPKPAESSGRPRVVTRRTARQPAGTAALAPRGRTARDCVILMSSRSTMWRRTMSGSCWCSNTFQGEPSRLVFPNRSRLGMPPSSWRRSRASIPPITQGQLHLDLKPSNILLDGDADGEWVRCPKVSDFGIARSEESGVTDTGHLGAGGTPSYMAPEQINKPRKELTPRADIHGLGAILYHMLTGRPPYEGATYLDTIDLLRRLEPVPPRRFNPKIPRDLETICLKCLEKEPSRHDSSAELLADDLNRFLEGKTISSRPASAIEKCWRWWKARPVIAWPLRGPGPVADRRLRRHLATVEAGGRDSADL